MSFFEKIAEEYYEDTQEGLIQSVAEQMAILFSNRHDKYWAYDFAQRTMVPIHEVFNISCFAPEFARKLAYAIEVFDKRVFDVQVSVAPMHCGAKIYIECKARYYDEVIKIPTLSFDL